MLTLGASGRPTIVLLHGFMGTGADWVDVAHALQPEFRCLMPDLPGHDSLPLKAGATGDRFGAYATSLWTKLEPQLPARFVLAGYSLGGRLALHLACLHPGRIDALVLESAHPGLSGAVERERRAAADADWIRRFRAEPWPQVLDAWYDQPVFASLSAAQRCQEVANRAGRSPEVMAEVLDAASLARQPDHWEDLPHLPFPIGFLTGRMDPKFCAVGDRMAELVPDLTLVKLDDLGHNCHAPAPQAVAGFIHRMCTVEHARP